MGENPKIGPYFQLQPFLLTPTSSAETKWNAQAQLQTLNGMKSFTFYTQTVKRLLGEIVRTDFCCSKA